MGKKGKEKNNKKHKQPASTLSVHKMNTESIEHSRNKTAMKFNAVQNEH